MKNNAHKPVLVLISDRSGDVVYPVPMMRESLGISERQKRQMATRETMPRTVTPAVQWPVAETPKAGLLRRMIDAGLQLVRDRL